MTNNENISAFIAWNDAIEMAVKLAGQYNVRFYVYATVNPYNQTQRVWAIAHTKNGRIKPVPKPHAYYLTIKRHDGNRVERFTDASALFVRVAEVAELFDYSVSSSYLQAAHA